MPFAPRIRKDMLKALDDYIIPVLQSQQVIQILAGPPFDFSAVQYHTERKQPLPAKEHGPLQIIRRWEKLGMVSVRDIAFGFVYTGVAYETIGITTALAWEMRAQGKEPPGGITVLRLPAPGIICYPPHIPRSSGHRRKPWPDSTQVFCVKLMDGKVLVSLSDRGPHDNVSTHNLEIQDGALAQMGYLYLDERGQNNSLQSAQAQLLAFMSRLRRVMAQRTPHISNTCWVNPESLLNESVCGGSKSLELCAKIIDYAQTHLHEPLSLEILSQKFGFSAFHLNRVFRQIHGTTIMHYITQLRIKAAQRIIIDTEERVGDVAKLVGFATPASFCNVFRKHTGCSPNEFRHGKDARKI